jgi:hypothetical protein
VSRKLARLCSPLEFGKKELKEEIEHRKDDLDKAKDKLDEDHN